MFDGKYDEAQIKRDFYEYIPIDHYWDRSTYPDDHKYLHMELEDFANERGTIFQEMIIALDAHLKLLGKETKTLGDEENWILAAYSEPEIAVLLERYNELESARFMKLYGATRVPEQLFTTFIGLQRAIISFSVPPILSVLKEYGTLSRKEQFEQIPLSEIETE